MLTDNELNAYDVLVSDWVVFTRASLPATRSATEGSEREVKDPETSSSLRS